MAHKITYISPKKANIELVRGDSFVTQVGYKKNGEVFYPEEGGTLTFTVRMNYKGKHNDRIVIQKTIDAFPNPVIELEPQDTESLMYGDYKYDIQYDPVDGRRDTPLQGIFTLSKEVT